MLVGWIVQRFFIYVFQLNGMAAKLWSWPDIRISQGDKGTFVWFAFIRQPKKVTVKEWSGQLEEWKPHVFAKFQWLIFLSTISRCWAEHNICFHSRIFGGIKTSGPGSWTLHVGGTRPLISFSWCIPLIWRYRIYAWPGLGERTARKRQRWGERMRHWRVLMVVQ